MKQRGDGTAEAGSGAQPLPAPHMKLPATSVPGGGQQAFSEKGQIVNILGFAGQTVLQRPGSAVGDKYMGGRDQLQCK